MTVYVDHAFAAGDWGRWSGGGHLQADTTEELHAFAAGLGMRREWFQSRPGRPEKDHYDLTRDGRERAIARGAVTESRRDGTHRRRARRADRPPPVTDQPISGSPLSAAIRPPSDDAALRLNLARRGADTRSHDGWPTDG